MATQYIQPASAPANPIHAIFGSMDRSEIEALIESAIAYCDEQDGDPDAEDGDEDRCCAYDDDANAFSRGLIIGHDSARDDDCTEEADILDLLPEYAVDQSRGPINEPYAEQLQIAAKRADELHYEKRFPRYDGVLA